MEVEIIKPVVKDLGKLISLWEEQYRYHHDLDSDYYVKSSEGLTKQFREYLAKSIEKNDPYILVALIGGEFVGFISFEIDEAEYFDTKIKKFGSVLELYVSEKYRRKGIGSKLMKRVENFFKEKGLNNLYFHKSLNKLIFEIIQQTTPTAEFSYTKKLILPLTHLTGVEGVIGWKIYIANTEQELQICTPINK